MIIKHDYSYMNLGSGNKLIEKDYAEMDIHSINFDRHFTEEIKENNRKLSETLSREEWSKHCDDAKLETSKSLLPIYDWFLNSGYKIHQITKETSTMEHYRTDWDLHFYSNKGWNGEDYFDRIQISFNSKKTSQKNFELLNEILKDLEKMDNNRIYCRVQYTAKLHEKDIKSKAREICENLLEKTIEYQGMKGRIKLIDEYNGIKQYGFFKSRAKTKYFRLSDEYLVLNFA